MAVSTVLREIAPASSNGAMTAQIRGILKKPSGRAVADSASKSNKTDVRIVEKKKLRQCMCSPSTHPGSFRCRLHRATPRPARIAPPAASSACNSGLERIGQESGRKTPSGVSEEKIKSAKKTVRFDL